MRLRAGTLAGVVLQGAGPMGGGGRVTTCGSQALHSGNPEGKPEPVKPTRHNVRLMARLLLPFNQKHEKKRPSCFPVCISVCRCLLLCPDWLLDNRVKKVVG